MKTKIFLTGFRGSGKTTLAKLLAEKLDFELIEMDELIVKRADKPITEITKDGKSWYDFRFLESEILKDIIKKEKIVVATGGGLFVNEFFGKENFDLVKELPEKLIIFLKVNEKNLSERIKDKDYNQNWRPPLSDKKNDFEIYRQRLPLYELRSDFIIDTSNQNPEESLKEILKLLNTNP